MLILYFLKRQKYGKSESWVFKAILPLKTNEKQGGKKTIEKEGLLGKRQRKGDFILSLHM